MVNSEPLHVAVWDSTLRQHGHTLSDLPEEFQATMAGKKPIAIAEGMVDELQMSVDPQIFLATKAEKFLALAQTNLQGMLEADMVVSSLEVVLKSLLDKMMHQE